MMQLSYTLINSSSNSSNNTVLGGSFDCKPTLYVSNVLKYLKGDIVLPKEVVYFGPDAMDLFELPEILNSMIRNYTSLTIDNPNFWSINTERLLEVVQQEFGEDVFPFPIYVPSSYRHKSPDSIGDIVKIKEETPLLILNKDDGVLCFNCGFIDNGELLQDFVSQIDLQYNSTWDNDTELAQRTYTLSKDGETILTVKLDDIVNPSIPINVKYSYLDKFNKQLPKPFAFNKIILGFTFDATEEAPNAGNTVYDTINVSTNDGKIYRT